MAKIVLAKPNLKDKETPVQPSLRIFWAKEQKCTHPCAINYDKRKSGHK